MYVDPLNLAAILAMAAVTYATRAGGFFLMRWLPLSPRAEEFLGHVPTAVIGALLAPALATGDPVVLAAVGVAFAVMLTLRHDLVAVGGAMAVAALARGLPH